MELLNIRFELNNCMLLFIKPDKIDVNMLIDFCPSEYGFNYLVFFDSKESAVFPQTPFSALYGDEEEPQRHIKAIYVYNKLNGYSVLTTYEKNKWESVPEEIKI